MSMIQTQDLVKPTLADERWAAETSPLNRSATRFDWRNATRTSKPSVDPITSRVAGRQCRS